ncbi:TetR family transcriptional regulator [Mycolicibacterium arabiense]|uniref:TetR family transcriptional regulator n=1 Tax=Mycolicibacterium arabiense TaxID=1286181 RepID=A0A7I7S4X0_9MYCO|nr:TetR/AcrR family transcriptional regulator [Mycolicibacterium arabiense]MCV7372319.1 TetR/AcrR family transcriptional regulator [Mycolicibacterium arabiense]BBY51441.1 TetR family transcriptional regulator [Mycolicibacterium arabiense]
MTAEPTRGRPRDPRTQSAILAAARTMLSTVGYEQTSMDAIAREAGVSRPTIYRRWPSKAHVVFDAVFGEADVDEVLANTGDFETDLREFVRAVCEFWRDPVVAAATMGILADRHRDPALSIRTQQLLDEHTRSRFAALVHSGVDQGAVARDVDVDMLWQALVGTSLYAVQVQLFEDVDDLAGRLCALAMQGASTRKEKR